MLDTVEAIRFLGRRSTGRVEVFDRLPLHDDRVGPFGENGLDGELVRHTKVAERTNERRVTRLTLVPPPTERRKARADEDLVDRREVANPGIAPRKRSRVIGK